MFRESEESLSHPIGVHSRRAIRSGCSSLKMLLKIVVAEADISPDIRLGRRPGVYARL